MYAGDVHLGETIDLKFTTAVNGAPFALVGGTVVAYPGNSTTEITAGITLTADLDGRTGLNNIRIVATSGNGYAAATNYALVLSAGTVNGVSVVGTEVGAFSIDARLTQVAAARGEPAQGIPPSSADLATKVDYLYKLAINKIEQDSTTLKIYNDAGTVVDHKATTSDDGTTYTRSDLVAGP